MTTPISIRIDRLTAMADGAGLGIYDADKVCVREDDLRTLLAAHAAEREGREAAVAEGARLRMALEQVATELDRLSAQARKDTGTYDEYHPGKEQAYDAAADMVREAIALSPAAPAQVESCECNETECPDHEEAE